jgi:hypothetical protein
VKVLSRELLVYHWWNASLSPQFLQWKMETQQGERTVLKSLHPFIQQQKKKKKRFKISLTAILLPSQIFLSLKFSPILFPVCSR